IKDTQGAGDILFSSKELLDKAGGITVVAQGYMCPFDSSQKGTGDIKIKGFQSNFAQYLNCQSRHTSDCGDPPYGAEKGVEPDLKEDPVVEKEEKTGLSTWIIVVIIVVSFIATTSLVVVISIIVYKKSCRQQVYVWEVGGVQRVVNPFSPAPSPSPQPREGQMHVLRD
ncbi:MAG: hypothetical protein EZS28_031999, partial [Streblomastix strix]